MRNSRSATIARSRSMQPQPLHCRSPARCARPGRSGHNAVSEGAGVFVVRCFFLAHQASLPRPPWAAPRAAGGGCATADGLRVEEGAKVRDLIRDGAAVQFEESRADASSSAPQHLHRLVQYCGCFKFIHQRPRNIPRDCAHVDRSNVSLGRLRLRGNLSDTFIRIHQILGLMECGLTFHPRLRAAGIGPWPVVLGFVSRPAWAARSPPRSLLAV